MFVARRATEMSQPLTAAATPEFMWCQRGDRVYVTIKVADCQETSVDVSSDHRLEFRGRGSGMCGQREYALSIQVARPVVKEECRWFVCGPSVRVRLEKAQHGPYWGALIADGVKMAQCKVSASTSISTATSTPTSPTSTHDPPPPPPTTHLHLHRSTGKAGSTRTRSRRCAQTSIRSALQGLHQIDSMHLYIYLQVSGCAD